MSSKGAEGQTRSEPRIARGSAIGAACGVLATLAFVNLPRWIEGTGLYEHTDALLGMAVLFVPLGALVGAVAGSLGSARGQSHSTTRRVATWVGFAILLWFIWEVWAVFTGAPSLL